MGVVQQGGQCQYCNKTGPIEVRQPDDGIRACHSCWEQTLHGSLIPGNPEYQYYCVSCYLITSYSSFERKYPYLCPKCKTRAKLNEMKTISNRIISLFYWAKNKILLKETSIDEPLGHPYRAAAKMEEEKKSAEKVKKKKPGWRLDMKWNYSWPETLLYGTLTAILFLAGWCIYKKVTTNDKIEHCYINYQSEWIHATEQEKKRRKSNLESKRKLLSSWVYSLAYK